jgi:hypothetical protein
MIKYLIPVVFIIALSYLSGIWLPWWVIAPSAGLVCFLNGLRPSQSFWVSFLAGVLLWGGLAYHADFKNAGILSAQIGELFGGLPGITLVITTGILGGLVTGLGGLTGSALQRLVTKTGIKA